MAPRSPHWVNSPVLLEALERYEQRRLPRSMQLWVEAMLELKAPAQTFGLAVNNVKVEPKLKLRLPKARIKA